jgi:hypothetical protein
VILLSDGKYLSFSTVMFHYSVNTVQSIIQLPLCKITEVLSVCGYI